MKAAAGADATRRRRWARVPSKTVLAARVCGVQNYFLEQNWELAQQSVAYLKTLGV
jgi:type VI protein secretion system component VasF